MLQDRYPAAPGALKTHYSSVELAVDAFTNQPKGPSGQPFVLFHAGSMTNYHKGQDALIRAAGLLMNRGWDLELRLAGDGPLRVEFEKLAHSLGISEKVRFFGLLPDQFEVQKELDRSDILIFPSRSEGLPRVIIEAMARGLPCIASRAGGIPELLPSEDTIPAVEPQLLAEKIEQVLSSPSRLSAMSKRNINSAREYAADVLDERRIRFQKTLKTKTEDWFGRQNGQI
jgi:glycosyltransferase involved in cell wall biosynthesis